MRVSSSPQTAGISASAYAAAAVAYGREREAAWPWRMTRSPWLVLLAEVLLQQTTALQVSKVFPELADAYPEPAALASDPSRLSAAMRPLGITRRGSRLLQAACTLTYRYGGRVPCEAAALQQLPGVGRYTAHAILCFSFGQPVPVVDSAAARVLVRSRGIVPTRAAHYTDPAVWSEAALLVPVREPHLFNWGLIDIGRELCTSRNRVCARCPLKEQLCVDAATFGEVSHL